VLSSLYFETDPPAVARQGDVDRVLESGRAQAIPLYLRFRAEGRPIVGTTLEYFGFRGLRLDSGRPMAVLGECVLGARAARELGLGPGDSVVSSPETTFDLAGAYPLELQIVGVLEPAHSPDDDAIFVDVKTTWVIEGLGHGHQDLARPEAESAVLSREDDRITANASVVEYNRITEANRGSFHFHGDRSGYPITAVIAVPDDARSRALLMGRYQGAEERSQIVRPNAVMEELLGTVFTVRSYLVAALGLVGIATVATASLVFLLSFRLRQREIDTMVKIGAAPASVTAILSAEVVLVLALGLGAAGLLSFLTERFGSAAIRALLLS
jgi:putative ABC transport system permease protein